MSYSAWDSPAGPEPFARQSNTTAPKVIFHYGMVACIMRHLAMVWILLALCISGSDAMSYLSPGSDAYGPALGYPAYSSPLSFPLFACGNNTTPISAVLLRATELRPEFEVWRHGNGSVYSHPLLPLWSAYSFYLPFPDLSPWSFGSYKAPTSSVNDFLDENKSRVAPGYDTQTIRAFALQDEYHEGVEAHDDPTRMGMSHFLDDDEPPGPPLL